MTRRDDRKAMEIRLPDTLRRDLVRTAEAHVPLAYLLRQVLRRAFDGDVRWQEPISPGAARPILLQLSNDERRLVGDLAQSHGVSEEVAILSLVGAAL